MLIGMQLIKTSCSRTQGSVADDAGRGRGAIGGASCDGAGVVAPQALARAVVHPPTRFLKTVPAPFRRTGSDQAPLAAQPADAADGLVASGKRPAGANKLSKGTVKLLKLFTDTISKAQPYMNSFAFESQYNILKDLCDSGVSKLVRQVAMDWNINGAGRGGGVRLSPLQA